jgi:hypothetical protein
VLVTDEIWNLLRSLFLLLLNLCPSRSLERRNLPAGCR